MTFATGGEDWRLDASCRGVPPDFMFPERGDNPGVARARALCDSCPVREDCLEDALSEQPQLGTDLGIRAGLSGRERRRLRAQRRRAALELRRLA